MNFPVMSLTTCTFIAILISIVVAKEGRKDPSDRIKIGEVHRRRAVHQRFQVFYFHRSRNKFCPEIKLAFVFDFLLLLCANVVSINVVMVSITSIRWFV